MKVMKRNKAFGVDMLPAEVLKSSCLTELLAVLFNKCFFLQELHLIYGNMVLFS